MKYNLVHVGTGYTDKLNVIHDLIVKHGAKKIGNIPQEIVKHIHCDGCVLYSDKIDGAKDFKIDAKDTNTLSFKMFNPVNKQIIIDNIKNIFNFSENDLPKITLQFRFLNHLGDKFEDGPSYQKMLPEEERKILLDKCISFLKKNYLNERVLIMTDSNTFQTEIKKFDNFVLSNAAKTHLPSENAFLNLLSEIYVASNTDAYLCVCNGLYKSRMLKYLPQIFNKNHTFKVINI